MTEDDQSPGRGTPAGRPADRLASATLGALRRGGRADRPVDAPGTGGTPATGTAETDETLPAPVEDAAPAVDEPAPAAVDLVKRDDTDDGVVSSDGDVDDDGDVHDVVIVDDVVVKPDPEPDERAADAPRGRRVSRWTAACALVAFLALVFAVVTGVGWWTSGHSEQRRIGLARDQISTDARLAIITVNTSDYRKPTAALDNWLRVSTGSLHSQFTQSRSAAAKLLGEAKMVTKAAVLDAAVTDVNLNKGQASVIASVNVTRTPVTGSVTTVRNRFRATMARVGGQWKLSDLTVVPVSLS